MLVTHVNLVRDIIRRDDGEIIEGEHIVVRGEAIRAHKATAEAAMSDHRLAVRTDESTDGCHLRAAGTGTVARPLVIDVAGIEAQGTVIAVPAAAHRRADEGAAVHALERLPPIPHRA